jgi:hypothetical protein
MTNKQILNHLIDVLKPDVSHSGGSILTSDLVQQDGLYNFQEGMSQFLALLANTVPGGPQLLAKEFPGVFVAR